MIDTFTKEEFEKALSLCGGEWTAEAVHGEWKHSAPYGGGRVVVSSSISVGATSRGTGKDSIRVVIEYNGKYKKTSQRWITRQPGWEGRLKEKIIEARILINKLDYSPKCPNCGGAMVIRSGVHGKFYGCLVFPKCRGTRSYEVPDTELMKIVS